MARPLTITAYGNAQVDTAESKSGGASALFDGTGDYLLVGNSNLDLDTTTSWTIEFWFYLPNPGSGVNRDHTVFSNANVYNASGDARYRMQINTNADNSVDYRFATQSIDSGTGDIDLISGEISKADTVDQWNHIAITRSGSTLKLYLDGTLKGTNASAAYSDLSLQEAGLGSDLKIGADTSGAGTTTAGWNGWLDEFRISNTIRYTSNFTPATRFVPDSNTMLLIHADGTDGSTTFTDDVGVQASANLTASFAIVEADGRTFLRNTVELPPITTALTATAVDDPSMVFLGNDVYTWDDLDTWDAEYLDDGRWVVWEILPTAFVLEAQALNLKLAQAGLDISTDISITGQRLPGGSSDLNTEFSLTATALNLDLASADLESSFTVAASAGIELNAEAALSISTELSVSALNLDLAEIQIADLFTMDVTAGVILDAQADLNTEFSLTATALNLDIAAALLAFDFAIEATALNLRRAQASLAVSTELTAEGNKFIVGQVEPMTMSFAVSTDADNFNIAAALLAFNFEITPRAGLILEPNELYDYTWDSVPNDTWDTFLKDQWEARGVFQDSQFTLAPLGGLVIDGAADLTAFATELVVGERLPGGSAALELLFESTIKATLIPSVLPFDLPVSTDLTASADLFVGGKADLEAFATELVVGERLPGGSADLTVNTELSAFAGIELNAQAALEVFGFQFSEGRLSDVRGQANLAFNFDALFAGDLRLLPSELVYKILRDRRQWTILGETRHYDVLAENRNHEVDDESTTLMILPESRVLDVEEMSA